MFMTNRELEAAFGSSWCDVENLGDDVMATMIQEKITSPQQVAALTKARILNMKLSLPQARQLYGACRQVANSLGMFQ